MKFFKSKYVKIFPCSRRGTYTITTMGDSETVTNSYVFDPEARMASEYNFTHLPGMNRGSKSYVSELSILPVPGSSPEESIAILSVIINGYYFELTFCSDALVTLDATSATPISCPTDGDELREFIKELGKLRICTETVNITEGHDHEAKRDLQYLGSVLWPAYSSGEPSDIMYHANTTTKAYTITRADLTRLGVDLPLGEDASDFICTAICIVPSNNTADPSSLPAGGKYFELDLNEDSNWVLRYQLGYDSANETLEIGVISP